jgi:hypothetical protein
MELYKSKVEIKKESEIEDNTPEWLRIVQEYFRTNYEKGLFPHYNKIEYQT